MKLKCSKCGSTNMILQEEELYVRTYKTKKDGTLYKKGTLDKIRWGTNSHWELCLDCGNEVFPLQGDLSCEVEE